MDLQLSDKLALVTGSTAGIGLAIAAGLAKEGARVILNGRTEDRVAEATAQVRKATPSAQTEGFAGDLSTPEAAETLRQKFPELDILINNLGIFEAKQFSDITDEDWLRFFSTNVLSGIRLARYYLPRMLNRNWGRIVFISSESAVQIPSEMMHYGMTKTAQLAVSRGLAETTAGTSVTVNTVLPGPTASEGVNQWLESLAKQQNQTVEQVEKFFFERMRPTSLLKRFATTEEVANLVVYLASAAASATNGAALRVDGGVVRSIV